MSVTVGARVFTDAGQMTCLNAALGIAAGSTFIGPWVVKQTGESYVEDLGISAVPGTAIRVHGGAFAPDGRRYVTTEAVTGTDTVTGMLRYRTDGALRVSTAAVGATDRFRGGWAIADTGEARMSIT